MLRQPGVISLGIGEPDLSPPSNVREGAKKAWDEGFTHYTPNLGIPELREAICQKTKREYGLSYEPSEVIVTAGAGEAIFLALQAFLNVDDEVLIPDPGFVSYEANVFVAGGTPVHYPLLEENAFCPTIEDLDTAVTDKTRVLIVNSPSNPTGAVYPKEVLASIADLAVRHDLLVISDECYEKFVYDDSKHYCLATFPGMRDRTVVINAFSKTYAMTGIRVGYALAPKEIIDQLVLIHQYGVTCAGGPAQMGALAGLKGSQQFVSEMVKEFDRRRKLIVSRINKIQGFQCLPPRGAFYLFANAKKFGRSSQELASLIFEKAKVVAVPGSAFGERGEGYLRFSYATPYERIEEAMNRIEKVASELASR